MNSRRSYLDSMNAGRIRRSSTSLDELNRTLDELEGRIGRHEEASRRAAPREESHHADRSLTYDMEPARRQAADARPLGGIAHELGLLREELRREMSAGLRNEFSALRAQMEDTMASARGGGQMGALTAEFDRLAAMINEVGGRGDDRQVNLLRLELEEVKTTLSRVAREETVQSVDRRWEELARRIEENEARHNDPAMEALVERLDQIGAAMGDLPTSLAMRSLEDKLKTLAGAVEQFAGHQEQVGTDVFDAIGERLDEISRAIAVSHSQAPAQPADHEAVERIEARIAILARQIGELVEDRPAGGLTRQMNALAERVDHVAERVDLPEQLVERLAGQMAAISAKLESTSQPADLSGVLSDMDDRFARIAEMLERRHGDALEQGRSLFVELERRLDEIGERVTREDQAGDLAQVLDARFSALAQMFEERAGAAHDNDAIGKIEARLEHIAARLDGAGLRIDDEDRALIRTIEEQVSAFGIHLHEPRENDREDLMEAARHAAESAVARVTAAGGDSDHMMSLAEDLKALEKLTRRSDDRNARTFEAIHDTLLKIVDRLGTMETAPRMPAVERSHKFDETETPPMEAEFEDALSDETEVIGHGGPQGEDEAGTPPSGPATEIAATQESPAAAEKPARRSLLGNLGRALKSRKPARAASQAPAARQEPLADLAAQTEDLDAPLDTELANEPMVPGSGAPDLNAIMRRVRDERGKAGAPASPDTAKSDFIAAARRAAQAAAAEAELGKRKTGKAAGDKGFGFGKLLKGRKRTLTLGVALAALVVAGIQIGPRLMAPAPQQQAELDAEPTVVAASDEAQMEAIIADVEEVAAIAEPPTIVAEAANGRAAAEAADRARRFAERALSRSGDAGWLQEPDAPVTPTATFARAAGADEDAAEKTELASVQPEALQSGETEAVQPQVDRTPAAAETATLPAGFEVPQEAGPTPLRLAAEQGDARAFYEIGNRYADGRGVDLDMAVAAQWYELAAGHGLAPAQYRIGNLYEKGIGVERDIETARQWYEQAAQSGNATAMHNLAVLHAMGMDGDADNAAAARWFAAAAEFGVRDSQFNLGVLTARGVGVTQDLGEAYKWFDLVARAGDRDAEAKRDEVAEALSPEQLERARGAAALWQARQVDADANVVDVPSEWIEDAMPTASVDMQAVVRNVQRILTANGFDAGPADGIMGARTGAAIAAFQEQQGMPATGEIDETLISALLEAR